MKAEVKKYLQKIGSKGGKIGGKCKSPEKMKIILANLAKARANRWPKEKQDGQ